MQSAINNADIVMNNLNTEQEQVSSGMVSNNFGGMASQTQQYLSLDNILATTNQYLTSNKVVETQINATSTALSSLTTVGTSLQSLLSERMSGTSNSAAFGTQLTGIWQNVTSLLNTNVNGQFIFSGTDTNTQSVNTNTFPALPADNTLDTSYYQGSSQDMTARPQNNTLITYNVRADATPFQQLFAGLALAKQGDATNDTDMLQQAETEINNAVQGITSLQATVGATASQFSNIDTGLTNQQLYWKGVQGDIGSTDIVTVSTQIASNQALLQAAFKTLADLTQITGSLVSYLK